MVYVYITCFPLDSVSLNPLPQVYNIRADPAYPLCWCSLPLFIYNSQEMWSLWSSHWMMEFPLKRSTVLGLLRQHGMCCWDMGSTCKWRCTLFWSKMVALCELNRFYVCSLLGKCMCWCRIVLKVTADPDQLRFAANVLMENGDGLSSGVSSAAIGEPVYILQNTVWQWIWCCLWSISECILHILCGKLQ